MARKNPTITTATPGPLPGSGVELPYTIGVDQAALESNGGMPDVNMQTNDGDQKGAPDAAFANGKDMRNKSGGPSGSDPTPAMPGA